MNRYMLLIVGVVLLAGGVAAAQESGPDSMFEVAVPAEPPIPPVPPDAPLPPDTFLFLSSEFEKTEEPVKNAPYSGEAVTERTQYLADGNRIYHKSDMKVFRDSSGRTRREQTLGHLGFWVSAEEPHTTIFIHDPVESMRYVLEPEEQIARKMPLHGDNEPMLIRRKTDLLHGEKIDSPRTGDAMFKRGPLPPSEGIRIAAVEGKSKTESLGKKVIEGVDTVGTRTITVIEAGRIGNDRPIEIVSEKWYSPQLKLTILSRNSDPRFGETIYRLVNIKRTEPQADLFKIPEGFKIVN
jgi:hypothetical protein